MTYEQHKPLVIVIGCYFQHLFTQITKLSAHILFQFFSNAVFHCVLGLKGLSNKRIKQKKKKMLNNALKELCERMSNVCDCGEIKMKSNDKKEFGFTVESVCFLLFLLLHAMNYVYFICSCIYSFFCMTTTTVKQKNPNGIQSRSMRNGQKMKLVIALIFLLFFHFSLCSYFF